MGILRMVAGVVVRPGLGIWRAVVQPQSFQTGCNQTPRDNKLALRE